MIASTTSQRMPAWAADTDTAKIYITHHKVGHNIIFYTLCLVSGRQMSSGDFMLRGVVYPAEVASKPVKPVASEFFFG